jgi:hypothetical protein
MRSYVQRAPVESNRRLALLPLLILVAAGAGCSGASSASDASGASGSREEGVRSTSEAMWNGPPPLPADPSWADGFSLDGAPLGTDGDGAPLYACRGQVGNSIAPGKTRKDWSACDIGYGGQEHWVTTYQTLVPTWTSGSYGSIPPRAFAFGDESGAAVFGCRAINPSSFSLQVGEIKTGLGACEYGYGGAQVSAISYTVLMGNAMPLTVVNRTTAVPLGAIPSGTDTDGSTLYSCATVTQGGLVIGKTKAAWTGCDVSNSGYEQFVSGQHFLVVAQMVAAPFPPTTTHPFIGGYDNDGSVLGVCNASYKGTTQVGKYSPTYGACNFGYGGAEISLNAGYDVLAGPSSNAIEIMACPGGCPSGY